MNLKDMADGELQDLIRAEGIAARRLRTIDDVEQSEALADAAKDLLTRRHMVGTCGREGLPDQG